MTEVEPPSHVLAAFGGSGELAPLRRGRGRAWRVGDLVLKPADLTPDELAWQAEVLPTVDARAAVIDPSLYWRPTAFATAIVVADALVWEGADESLVRSVVEIDDFGQMLIRALLFRIVAAVEGGFEGDKSEIERHYRRGVDLAMALVTLST